mmetsp:Transcript_67255/g.132468  ORF Transcript_67255/g.132468 Transcript_67255/m.132468 type:complete len:250 (+) Transcript_67255:248-997(+)
MNGTGLKRPDGKAPQQLEKRVDVAVQDDSVILVPMMIKVNTDPNLRAWLKVDVEETTMESADVSKPAKANKSAKNRSAEPAPAAQEAVSEEDAEKARTKFVELLLNTREISAGTTYEEAKKLLASSDGWHAVDEGTRKECFDIFVEHLGSHQSSKKKDKKKKKEKGKEKSKKGKKHEDEEQASGEKEAPEVVPEPSHDRKRKRRAGSGGASPDRTRRRDKKGGNRRSRSGSRAEGGAGKRRRRGRSSSP